MKAVTTLNQIAALAMQQRCIYCEASPRRVFPAAVLLAMTGSTIYRYLIHGVFEYEAKQRKYSTPWNKTVDSNRKGPKVKKSKA